MTTPPSPPGPDDTRDPRVAAWLAVDPLDDVTRARLVRDALAGSADAPTARPHPHRRRTMAVVGVAAAVVAALVVVGAVLVPRGDDTTPSAVDAPASKARPEASRPAGDSSAAGATAEAPPAETLRPGPLPALGDLGDVSSEAKLERAARGSLSVPLGSPSTPLTGCAAAAGRAFGTPIAVGTGRIDGRRATVVAAHQAAGSTAVVAVAGRTCGRAVSVVLP